MKARVENHWEQLYEFSYRKKNIYCSYKMSPTYCTIAVSSQDYRNDSIYNAFDVEQRAINHSLNT